MRISGTVEAASAWGEVLRYGAKSPSRAPESRLTHHSRHTLQIRALSPSLARRAPPDGESMWRHFGVHVFELHALVLIDESATKKNDCTRGA